MAGEDSAKLGLKSELAEGLKLQEYSLKTGLSEREVWEQVNRGELIGRAQGSDVRVFLSPEAAENAFDAEGELPPLPGSMHQTANLPSGRDQSTEVALLLDHLSLAKEENREILKMAQESIRKVSELSESLMETKNLVIEGQTQEILLLREALQKKDAEIKDLKRKHENLEMLAQAALVKG